MTKRLGTQEMSDFSKPPTDARIIKAFNQFEEAFNVADALLRLEPERAFSHNSVAVEEARYHLIKAQRVFHNLARKAHERRAEANKK